ncbi:hypothetical protein [Arcobacter sp.]|uniref:hypothetical protein n=1 Tax=Arcobacter sp. TaxID=1872629 RepID=UPI003D09E513
MNKLVVMAIVTLISSSNIYATDTHSGQAAKHAANSGSNASGSAAHAIMSSGKVASAAASVPLAVVGSVGEVSKQISKDLMDAATAPIGTPLEITEESIVAGPPPNEAIKANKQ